MKSVRAVDALRAARREASRVFYATERARRRCGREDDYASVRRDLAGLAATAARLRGMAGRALGLVK